MKDLLKLEHDKSLDRCLNDIIMDVLGMDDNSRPNLMYLIQALDLGIKQDANYGDGFDMTVIEKGIFLGSPGGKFYRAYNLERQEDDLYTMSTYKDSEYNVKVISKYGTFSSACNDLLNDMLKVGDDSVFTSDFYPYEDELILVLAESIRLLRANKIVWIWVDLNQVTHTGLSMPDDDYFEVLYKFVDEDCIITRYSKR